jgi:transcription initiation factor TFIIB
MCPICKRNDKIITDTGCGEVICSNCGTVVSDRGQGITSPERLAFNSQEKNIRSRTGIPLSLTFADMGLQHPCFMFRV